MLILKQKRGGFFQLIYIRRQKLISTFVEISTSSPPPAILRGKTVTQTQGKSDSVFTGVICSAASTASF